MKRLGAAAIALALAAPACAAEKFGKLFFTPTERAQLDHARAQKQRPPVTPEESAAAPQVLTYSGLVRRSDGRAVLWLNNRPMDEKEAMSSLPVAGRVRNDGAVTVQVPQTGRTVELKVGQSLELTSGEVAERAGRTRLRSRDAPPAPTAGEQKPAAAAAERAEPPLPAADAAAKR